MPEHKVESAPPAAAVIPAAVRESGADVAAEEELLATTDWPGELFVQRKLQLGSVDDPLEDEAVRVADHVLRMPAGPVAHRVCEGCEDEPGTVSRKASHAVMRKCSACEQEGKSLARPGVSFLQRQSIDDSGSLSDDTTAPPIVHDAIRSPGQPLDLATRAFFEPRFGRDFSGVRVHTDAQAGRAARSIDAEAYTVGNHIAFAAHHFDVASLNGRGLLAHELAHVVQQGGTSGTGHAASRHGLGGTPAVQRRPDSSVKRPPDKPRASPEASPSIVMILAYSRSKSSAVATLSDDTVEPVRINTNTLAEGDYTFERDRSAPLEYRLVGQREGQAFVWTKKKAYRWADTVRVIVRDSPQERISALPPHIRDFLTTTRSNAPKASEADLVSIASAGRILEMYGVTEDELSLLELAEADRRGIGGAHESEEGGDPVGWALAYVEGRQAAAEEAGKTRDDLKQNSAQFQSAWNWRENPAAAAFEQGLEVEVRAVATSILNATEAAIYRMDRRFIGAYQPAGLGPGFVSDVVDVLRADPEIQTARKELQIEQDWKPPRSPSPDEIEERNRLAEQYYKEGRSSALPDPWWSESHVRNHARRLRARKDELNELVRVKTNSGLQIGNLPRADAERLLAAKTASGTYNVLRDMLYEGRVAVRDARRRLDDAKALFGADIVVATEKALLGVKAGSVLDQIIDDIVRERTAPSIWDRIVDIVSLVAMFIPGGFGIAIRAALATVQSVRSVERFTGQATLNRGGLSSVEPSGGALAFELIVTAGGVVLDKATAANVAGRGKVLDLAEQAPIVPHATLGEPVPTEMRGVQMADEAHSIQVRPAEVPVPATAAEVTALRNTEVSALGRRTDLARDLERLRLERSGVDGAGGLRGQIAKRDKLLEAGTLNETGKDNVRRQIKDLETQLDTHDAEIARVQSDLSTADQELAHVRGRLRSEGAAPTGQPTQMAAGRLREAEVGEAFQLGPKNNELMRDPNPGGSDFIPDFIDGNPASLAWGKQYHFREVKDWADMSDTGNLSAMLDYVSNNTGSRLTIYYRSNTYMSGPLTSRIEALMKTGKVDLVPFAGE